MTIAIGVNDPGAVTGNARGGLTMRKSPAGSHQWPASLLPATPNRARRFTTRVREVGIRAAVGVPIIVDGSVWASRPLHSPINGRQGSVGEDTIELAARLDAELGENLAQVVLDGTRADEQADANLRI